MRLVIPPHGVVGVCARARFSLLSLAVDFCRRLPGGPSVIGGKGEVTVCCACAEQTAARGFTTSSPCFVPVDKTKPTCFSRRLSCCLSLLADQTPVPPSP